MRPRFFNRGEGPVRVLTDAGRSASMRPRFFNRGETFQRVGEGRYQLASMRPRFFNRGEGALDKYSVFNGLTQANRAAPAWDVIPDVPGPSTEPQVSPPQTLNGCERSRSSGRHLLARKTVSASQTRHTDAPPP